jgi:hypothetical protein
MTEQKQRPLAPDIAGGQDSEAFEQNKAAEKAKAEEKADAKVAKIKTDLKKIFNDGAKIAEAEKPEKPKNRERKWSFGTVSKCPRCGTTDTICRRTDNKIGRQYRQCQRAICRWKYSVQGKKV